MLRSLRQGGVRLLGATRPIPLLMIALLAVGGEFAQTAHASEPNLRPAQRRPAGDRERCWEVPPPATIEEALKTAENKNAREPARRAANAQRDVLLLSNGVLKAAYGAGLLVGWGETGNRPRFTVVTAVGVSALIAPFAFIGPKGDQAIADIFNCSTEDLAGLAGRAASYLDDEALNAIAREHDDGRRLLVALPGSAARPEVVWDIGRLAASRHPSAASHLTRIFVAAVDRHSFVDPKGVPADAGHVVERNLAFREPGAGEEFLFPPHTAGQVSESRTRHHLIHNERIFPDESADYIRERSSLDHLRSGARAIVPAYDIIRHSQATNSSFSFASIKLRLGLMPAAAFDPSYLRALFLYAYREGRMGKEWKSTFPGLSDSVAKPSR